MKLAIFGNNDGPLRLLRALNKAGEKMPSLVALQKPVSENLALEYKEILGHEPPVAKNESQLLEVLSKIKPELLINCFGNFIFRVLLDHYEVLNIHPSPLPSYRGRHPIHQALINGEKHCGISIHRMEPKVDAGIVYWQKLVEVKGYPSVSEMREELLNELENDFAGFHRKLQNNSLEPIDNNGFEESYFSPMTPQNSEITDWKDPVAIVRKVNALRDGGFPAFANLPEKIEFNAAWLDPKPGEIQKAENNFRYAYDSQVTLVLAGPQPIPPHLTNKIDDARTLS